MRYPVSFAQRRVWAIDQLVDAAASNLCHASWLDGQVDTVALQQAMDVLVARHAVLRTSIVSSDVWPEQVVADTGQVPIDHVVLADGPDGAARAELLAVELAGRPFDLARGPLLRAALIEVADQPSLFVLAAHRIIADDVALAILLDELSTVYQDSAAALPPLWMDYGDYAVWQRERLRGEELSRQLDHWHESLRDAPTDRPRTGAASSAEGALVTASIDPTSTRRLADIAKAAGTDLSTAVLAGYAVVLARYARQADLVIGVPVHGRIRVELAPIVGPFADTVPVRVSLGDTATFAEVLDQVRDVSAAARSHDELPLDLLAEELGIGPVGRAARFMFGPPTAPALNLPGVTVRGRVAFPVAVESDLDLTASDDGTLTLGYRTDVVDPRLADRFLRSLVTVLENAGRAPHTPVADLPLLRVADSALLTGARPAPPTTFDVLRSLRESTATVTDGAATVAMPTVCDRAARLARTLAEHGVGPGTRVGVCFDRGIGMLTALLGVWWAGGAIVALEPGCPLPRLEIMAREAGLRLVVSDDHTGSLDLVVITPGDNAAEPLDPVAVSADALAYTVFTSGPTGPTGVDITHRALVNVLAVGRRDLGLGPGDRFVAVTTTAFDIALWELLLPLVCGADLVIAAAEDTGEAGRLRSLIERSAATAMHAPPHLWRLLRRGGAVPASLRLRLCGGERLPRDLAASLAAPDAVLWHLYGHTESTMWTAAGVVAPGEGSVAIGPAIDHTRVYVLDGRLVPVPVGVVGEVHIAGVGVARGDTSTAFRPDPWATEPGASMYATGDLGRWREDGGLELVGRTDRRVTIRGVRVDCGEVEAVLRAHNAIRDAAVVGVPRADETALVAYVVSDSDGPSRSATELLQPHLRAALPEAMVPTLVALPALPLTRAGDVDHAALPAPEWAVTQGVAPRNPVEATMAKIWADLLRTTEPIGVHDNLFRLGTGSLAAIRFAARIADTYGVRLPMHRIVATPTIAALAEFVSADLNANHVAETAGDAELAALSDDELDDLLRAVLAARDRRRATRSDGQ
jgi:amino acid adenylation domain-containing protein